MGELEPEQARQLELFRDKLRLSVSFRYKDQRQNDQECVPNIGQRVLLMLVENAHRITSSFIQVTNCVTRLMQLDGSSVSLCREPDLKSHFLRVSTIQSFQGANSREIASCIPGTRQHCELQYL